MSMDADAGVARRQELIAQVVLATRINEPMIQQLVRRFYEQARADPLLGPVFNDRVKDWNAHLARLCDFWSSITLVSGRYHGQPVAVHALLPIEAHHFERWLQLFAQTAHEVCPPPAAQYFIERARRVADSLELGMTARRAGLRRPRIRPLP